MAVDDFPVSCPFGNFHCNLLNKCRECLDQVYKHKEIGVRICLFSEDNCKAADCPQHGIFKQETRDEFIKRVNARAIVTPEPPPKKNDHPAVWSIVIKDMLDRDNFGYQKYGIRLQPHNERDALKDAYQEALDLAVYLRQAIYERDGK